MRLLPFNFDSLDSGRCFISNAAGFHSFLDRTELEQLIGFSTTSDPTTNKKLESSLFIADESNLEVATYSLGSALSKKLLKELDFKPIFMIVPTLRCDHTCSYCQVSRASVTSTGFDLDSRHIPRIIETIKNISSPPYKIEIQGGEPLLCFELIKAIYEEAQRQLPLGSFEFIIATSLSLLDDEVISWAKDRGIYFSTSLDGNQVVHDKNRILPGNSSFEKLKSSVKRIQSEIGFSYVSTVTTVTKELLGRPEALIEAQIELGIPDMFVRPISPYGFAKESRRSIYSVEDYMEFYRELFSLIKEKASQGIHLVEHSASIHMKRVFAPGFSQYADLKSPSGFILNSLLFNYDGKVYGSDEARMLQRVLDGVDFSIGSLDSIDFRSNILNAHILKESFNLIHPGCQACAYQPFCGADPCQNIAMQGEPVADKSLSTFCNYHKSMFRFLLNEYEANPSSQDILYRWCHG